MAEPMSPWLTADPDAAEKYPHYYETAHRLEAVLDLAQLQGVSGAEITAILASLHARAVARLHPNEEQLEYVVNVFRQTAIASMTDQPDQPAG